MSNYIIQQGLLLESFNNINDWTITTGTGSVDSSGLRLTTNVGSSNVYATKTISANLLSRGNFKIRFYIDNETEMAKIDAVDVYLSSSSTFAKYFNKLSFYSNLRQGHNELIISRNDWSNTGTDDWGNTMVRLRVRLNTRDVNVPATATFESIYMGQYSRPKCILNFDDGYLATYTQGYAYMRKYGFKGTSYYNSNNMGKAAYLTKAQMDELYAAGWDIGNHTASHPNLTLLTRDQVIADIQACEDYLVANGYTRRNCYKHFCYPAGYFNQSVVDAIDSMGFLTARTTLSNRVQANILDNRLLLLWQNVPAEGDTATAFAAVDRTIAGGGVLMWGFHNLVPTVTIPNPEWDITSFQALVDYLAQKKEQIDVVTTTEWYAGLSSPRKLA